MRTWTSIYRLSDGLFLRGDLATSLPFDPGTEGSATFDLDTVSTPSMAVDRYTATGRRPATAQEKLDYALAQVDAQAVVGAGEKALLSLCATMLEKFDPAWAGMTAPQKKTAVNALAARWTFWRSWAERNL